MTRTVANGVARAMRESDRRTNQQVLGAVLLAIGGNWLLAELGLFTFGWPGLFAVALMTLGVGMLGTAKAGRTKPLIALGIVLTLGLGMSSGVGSPVRGHNFGDRLYRPTSFDQVRDRYALTAGELTVDLSAVDFPEGLREIEAKVGFGELRVVVPRGLAVDITAEVGAGDIEIFDAVSQDDGVGANQTYRDENFRSASERVQLALEVGGPGEIVVERA